MRRKRMSFCPPGRWSRKRGKKNEKRVLRAIQRDPPDFVRSVRLATKEEDAYGIDIVIETYSSDVPVLWVQVKSGIEAAWAFKAAHEYDLICVIVVLRGLDFETLQQHVHRKITRLYQYQQYLAKGGKLISRLSPERQYN